MVEFCPLYFGPKFRPLYFNRKFRLARSLSSILKSGWLLIFMHLQV